MKGGVPCTTTRSALSPALPALERFPERRKSGRSEGEGERMRRRAPCATRTTFAQRMAGWSEARSAEFRSAALRTFGVEVGKAGDNGERLTFQDRMLGF